MSIAVSTTVLPSRILVCMLAFMFALGNAAIGYSIFCLKANKVSMSIVVISCIVLSVYVLLRYYRRQQAVRLDISDSGDIVFRYVTPESSSFDPINMKLSARSTIWPQLMMLSLRSEGGKIVVVSILRDSVDAAAYRKLSVALSWIAMHTSSKSIFGADPSSGNF
jgi:toxin CptA